MKTTVPTRARCDGLRRDRVDKLLKNKGHRTAHENGLRAAEQGHGRIAPYDCRSRSQLEYRRAWFLGYDSYQKPKETS
jgi:ribosomal protein L20